MSNMQTHYAIIGGGSAGWMMAASLSRALGGKGNITLVESEAIGTVGVGEATIPPIKQFNQSLGITEAEFVRATSGSFKLGIQFNNWARQGDSYFHPFGTYGVDFDPVAIHQHWLAANDAGNTQGFDEYSMAWALAKRGKFSHPSDDPRLIQSSFDYAYHFDTGLYAKFLRRLAERQGVKRIEGKVIDVKLDTQSGAVSHVTMKDGKNISADIFIDATGFRALLIGQAMGIDYQDWSHWLPCDRAVTIGSKADELPLSYTRATACDAGWQWRIPLQQRTGNGYVYCSAYCDDETAEKTLLNNIDTPVQGTPRRLRFTTGMRDKFWHKNVISLGLSAGFMEPLESTSLHLIQTAIRRFIALLPDSKPDPILADEFNRITTQEYETIRDFLILHYKATQRDDSPLWQYCKSMDIPDSLETKMAHWQRDGRLISDGIELFANPSWQAVYIGQRVMPRLRDTLLLQRGLSSGAQNLEHLRQVMAQTAETCPSHSDFIAKICGAS